MKLADHPTVQRIRTQDRTIRSARPTESLDAGMAASTVPRLRGRRRWAWSRSAARPWTTSGTTSSSAFPPHQDTPQLRLPHESGADPQHRPARSPTSNSTTPAITSTRSPARSWRLWKHQGVRAMNPAMGFPMEMDRFPGGKIWVVSHKPVAVAAGLGHMGIHRNVIHPKFGNFILLGTVLIAAEATAYDQPIVVQPVPGMQAVRGGMSRGGHLPGRRLQLLGLLHAQLPGVHGRLHRLGRADRRQQERPGLPQEGDRSRIGVDVAKPLLRGELQGGVLPERLPGWGRCHRPIPHRQGRASAGNRSSAAGEGRDDLRRPRLGRRGSCRPPLPAQDDQTSRQRPAAPDDPSVSCRGCLSRFSRGRRRS